MRFFENIHFVKNINFVYFVLVLVVFSSIADAANVGKAPEAFSYNAPSGPNVDLFTGDLSFSVPLLSVQSTGSLSVPLSLSYAAGIPVEAESSWVGLGWYLSPGAITRDVNGIPDDYFSEENKNNRHVGVSGMVVKEPSFFERITGSATKEMDYSLEGISEVESGDSAYLKRLSESSESFKTMQDDAMAKMGGAGDSAAWDFGGGDVGYGGGGFNGHIRGFDDGFFYTIGCRTDGPRNSDCSTPDSYKVTGAGLNGEMIVVGGERDLKDTDPEDSKKRFAFKNPSGRVIPGKEDPMKVELLRDDNQFIGYIITDKSGVKYTFDEPLYHVNKDGKNAKDGPEACNEDHVYQRVSASIRSPNRARCDLFKEKYAYAWLLTKIEDAQGNSVEFVYEKYDNSFHFRTPFGPGGNAKIPSYYFNDAPAGEGFTDYDGSLTASDGWMELAFLKEINTPVQQVKFIVSDRLDAVEYDENAAGFLGKGRKKKLDKIEIYVKGKDKNMHHKMSYRFVYDYSLQQGVPSSVSQEAGNQGRLTLKELWTLGENDKLPENAPLPYRFEYGNNAKPGELGNPNYVSGAAVIQSIEQRDGFFGTENIPELEASGIVFGERQDRERLFLRGIEYIDYRTDQFGYFWEDGNFLNHRIEDRWYDGRHELVYFEENSKPLFFKQHGIDGVKAWSLTKIWHPTGASTSIDYEADRYAFVGREPTILEIGDGDVWGGLGLEMKPEGNFITDIQRDEEDCYKKKFDRTGYTPFPIEVRYFYPSKEPLTGQPTRGEYYEGLKAFLDLNGLASHDGASLPGKYQEYFKTHRIENLPDSIAESNRVLHYGGGLRVKQLTHNDGLKDYTTRYQYVNSIADARTGKDDAFSSSGVASKPSFELNQRLAGLVGYRKVIEQLPNDAYVVHEFNSPYEYPVQKAENYKCFDENSEFTFTRLQDPAYFWDPRDTFQDTSYVWGQETKTSMYSSTGDLVAEKTTEYSYEPQEALKWSVLDPIRPELVKEQILPYFITPKTIATMQEGVTVTGSVTYADNGLPETQVAALELEEKARVSKTEYSQDKKLLEKHIVDKPKRILVGGNDGKWLNENRMEYDDKGKVKSSTQVDLESGKNRVTTYGYDKYGNVETLVHPGGSKEEIRYQQGYLPERGWSSLDWSSESKPLWKNEVDGLGRIVKMLDANGNAVAYSYDGLSRLDKVVEVGDNLESPTMQFAYDSDQIPLARKTLQKFTEGQKAEVDEYYDGHARLLQSQKKKDNDVFILSQVGYDEMGKPVRSYKPVEVGSGGAYIDEGGFYNLFPGIDYVTTEYYRDPLARVAKVRAYGDKNIFAETLYGKEQDVNDLYEYPVTTFIDENGNEALIKKDHFGNTIEVKEPDSETGKITEKSFVTTNTYDVLGRLTSQRNALWQVALSNSYNSFNQVIKSFNPDLGTTEFVYDKNGNIKEKNTAKGRVAYEYDVANRVVKASYSDGGSYAYGYDFGEGATSCENGKEKLCWVKGEFGKVAYNYDARGRVKQIVYELSGKKYSITYEYDSADNIIAVVDPAGVRSVYSYDDAGRLKEIMADTNGDGVSDKRIAAYSYNAASTVDNVQFGNNVATKYRYNVRDWLQSIDTASNLPVLQRYYEFDNTGNILGLYNAVQPENKLASFGYDKLYRLGEVKDNGYYGTDMSFTYDAAGDRKSLTTKDGTFAYTYGYEAGMPDSLKLVSVTGPKNIAFEYDAAGNMIQRNEKKFRYDVENRLECFGDYVYVYDHKGDRIKKIKYYDKDKALVTVYVYAGGNLVYEDTFKTEAAEDWKALLRCAAK